MTPNCNLGKRMFKFANTIKATEIITNWIAFSPPTKG